MSRTTGRFTLCPGFYDEPPVAKLLFGSQENGTAPLGLWVLLGSYHAVYPAHDIPHGARRMCGGKPRDVKVLASHGFLLDTGEKSWRLGYENQLWWITYSRDGTRALIPPEVRAAVYERDEWRCVQCGSTEDLTLDHITPWSHGGADTTSNLRTLCRSCNSRRGNRIEVLDGA